MKHIYARCSIVLFLATVGSGCGEDSEPSDSVETEGGSTSGTTGSAEGGSTATSDEGGSGSTSAAGTTTSSSSGDESTSTSTAGSSSGSTGGDETTGTGTDTDGVASASPGCGQALPEGWLSDYQLNQGGWTQVAMVDVDGWERPYLVGLPENYDPDKAYPVHMVFHALTSNMDHAYGLDVKARWDEPVIAIAPQGHPYGSNGYAWTWSDPDGADHQYIQAMLEELGQHACVDTDRVFASGTSNGAYMANAVACFTGAIRGMGASAGGMPIDASACVKPTTAFLMHGTNDTTVPLSAGIAARNKWLSINGCTETTQSAVDGRCQHYDDCTSGEHVYWCAHDGTHPESNPNSLGFSGPMISIFGNL